MIFVHTSDWHLGHVYRKLGALAGESAQWRFEAVQRVFNLASERRADFILVAGDVFDTDTPSIKVKHQAAELLREAPAPVYLISGNHDPCAEGSVWLDSTFTDALRGVSHVHLARENKELQVNNGDAVLFPCPVYARHSRDDATRWIPDSNRGSSQARIGLAHGGREGYGYTGEAEDMPAFNQINAQVSERCGLDYLALGDYHGYTTSDHPAAKARTYYSGTPEIGASKNTRGGHALVVQLEKPGADPRVEAHFVGRLRSYDWGTITLQPGTGLDGLQALLQQVENRENAMVRARLRGCVSVDEQRELQAWANALPGIVLAADVDTSQLLTEPTLDDFRTLRLEASEQHLLELLDMPLNELDLTGVGDRDIVATWSRDEAARRAARTLFYQLLRGEN